MLEYVGCSFLRTGGCVAGEGLSLRSWFHFEVLFAFVRLLDSFLRRRHLLAFVLRQFVLCYAFVVERVVVVLLLSLFLLLFLPSLSYVVSYAI